eukprot:5972381-Pleurochrysis_carterae.AAC.1
MHTPGYIFFLCYWHGILVFYVYEVGSARLCAILCSCVQVDDFHRGLDVCLRFWLREAHEISASRRFKTLLVLSWPSLLAVTSVSRAAVTIVLRAEYAFATSRTP